MLSELTPAGITTPVVLPPSFVVKVVTDAGTFAPNIEDTKLAPTRRLPSTTNWSLWVAFCLDLS